MGPRAQVLISDTDCMGGGEDVIKNINNNDNDDNSCNHNAECENYGIEFCGFAREWEYKSSYVKWYCKSILIM